eukprot:SAG11_NODE_765_length_7275_cov_16.594203_4_plen_70_part_00
MYVPNIWLSKVSSTSGTTLSTYQYLLEQYRIPTVNGYYLPLASFLTPQIFEKSDFPWQGKGKSEQNCEN